MEWNGMDLSIENTELQTALQLAVRQASKQSRGFFADGWMDGCLYLVLFCCVVVVVGRIKKGFEEGPFS